MKKLLAFAFALASCLSLAQVGNVSLPNGESKPVRPTRIDTRMFFPQIDQTSTYPGSRPRVPSNPRPELEIRLPMPFEGYTGTPGQIGNYEHPSTVTKFPGISFTNSWPPDTHMAVGPSHVVLVVNSDWAIYNKSTGAVTLQQNLDTFFGASGTFDPKVIYDRISNRWVIIALTKGGSTSTVEFAVSDDNDPNGNWNKYSIDSVQTLNGVSCWLDYPGLGYNKDAYVVTGNMFSFANSSQGIQWIVIPKSVVFANNTLTAPRFIRDFSQGSDLAAFTFQVAEMNSATNDKIHTVATTAQSNGFAQIYTLANLTGTPTIASQLVDIPAYARTNVDARSNTKSIDGMDSRVFNAFFRDNKLYFAHTINNSNPLACRWYELNINATTSVGTVSQTGDVTAGTDDAHQISIAKSDAGRVGMVYTRSGPTVARAADIMFTSRLDTDPVGTVATPTMLSSSSGSAYDLFRWGDYSATAIDPSDGSSFWVAHMTIASNNLWRTEFFKVDFGAALSAVSIAASTVEGGLSTSGTVTLSANAPTGGLAINLSDGGNVFIGVPGSVTVPAGSSTANFVITTSSTTTNQPATVTATQGAITRTANMTVIPIALPATLSLNPTSVAGGNNSTATVTLDRNAPTAGTVVNVSDNSAFASVPATVTVAGGANSATFAVTTTPTSSTVAATISVSRAAVTRSQTLTIAPPKIADFQITGASIQGGNTTSATVTLNGPAPANRTINISDNSAATTVPATAIVTTGNTQTTFNITTIAVSSNQVSTILVSLNGVGKTDTLTVLPPVLNSITINVTSIKGGLNAVGTLNMSSPAPAAGLPVTCSSNNTAAATVPATVVVSPAAVTKTFTITTKVVTSSTLVTISATRASITRTRGLTVTP